jgi:hypothetical protein
MTVARGSKLALYLSDAWKEMDYQEKRPFVEASE